MSRIVLQAAAQITETQIFWVIVVSLVGLIFILLLTYWSDRFVANARVKNEAFFKSLKHAGSELKEDRKPDEIHPHWKDWVFVWVDSDGNKYVSLYAESTLNSRTRVVDGHSRVLNQALGNLTPYGEVVSYDRWKTLMPKPSIEYTDQ